MEHEDSGLDYRERGRWLEDLARAKGWRSVESAAMGLEVARQTISRWYAGGGIRKRAHIRRICEAFGVTEEQLQNGPWRVQDAPGRTNAPIAPIDQPRAFTGLPTGTVLAPPAPREERGAQMIARDIGQAMTAVLRHYSAESQLAVLAAIIGVLPPHPISQDLGNLLASIHLRILQNRATRKEPPHSAEGVG